MTIKYNTTLKLNNVLSHRKKINQADVPEEMMKISEFLKKNSLKKAGPVVTATFGLETVNEEHILDTEILVPIDRKAEFNNEYQLKEKFHLVNAVSLRHLGDPNQLQDTYDKLLAYIKNNRLQQITAIYNVQVNDLLPGQSLDEMIIDVYIGVNPAFL